jgi:hypothetical protein
MAAKSLDSRCKATAKTGRPCEAAATASGLCFFHGNPNRASELGRIGGRSTRHADSEGGGPPLASDNAVAVRDTLARLIADLYAGRIQPRVASSLAALLSLQLRAIEVGDHEQRLANVEKRLGKPVKGRS